MNMCPKCGNEISYNSNFKAYICCNCNPAAAFEADEFKEANEAAEILKNKSDNYYVLYLMLTKNMSRCDAASRVRNGGEELRKKLDREISPVGEMKEAGSKEGAACDSCKCDKTEVKESFPRLSDIKPCDAMEDTLCLIDYDIRVLEERVEQLKSASDLLRIAAGYAGMTADEAEDLTRIEKLCDEFEWAFGYVMKHELACLPDGCER